MFAPAAPHCRDAIGIARRAMKSLRTLLRSGDIPFVAVDFETADHGRDSACAVALVRVEADRIVARRYELIRPPRRSFLFSWLHGIHWDDVADKPSFAECWPGLCDVLRGARFLAAHNSAFD